MKDNFELKIDADGTIQTIYQEGIEEFAKDLGADLTRSCRASNVEWEEIGDHKGWTVRAAHDSELAIRSGKQLIYEEHPYEFSENVVSKNDLRSIIVFQTREEALAEEVKFFWQLLPPKE